MSQEMLEAGPQSARILSVFDFDGTLTRRDSFVPFLRFAFGNGFFARRMLRMIWPSLRYMGRRISRDELKAQLIQTFLAGVKEQWVAQKAVVFKSQAWARLMRPQGVISVKQELASGAEVTICSASPALVLKPFAEQLGIKLIGTELEVIDGVLTGRISGDNCRCEAKVLRLEAVYGVLTQYRMRAWGDTRGDHELLAAAQDAHWRHFHPAWQRGRLRIEKIYGPVTPATSKESAATTVGGLPRNDDRKGG